LSGDKLERESQEIERDNLLYLLFTFFCEKTVINAKTDTALFPNSSRSSGVFGKYSISKPRRHWEGKANMADELVAEYSFFAS